jgi:spore germination cell wall hydrolase CwlJ-like protein
MNQALAISSPLEGLKARASALKARAVDLGRAYPRETIGLGVLGLIGFAAIAGVANSISGQQTARAAPPAPPPLLLKQVAPDQAVRMNAAIPVASGPNPSALPFVFKGNAAARTQALQCLASAVYYEAGNQDADGERAVAQVVLNRVRHPAFPASVCGVVYEGSTRTTGCQFTFTCDGSLLRQPVAALWTRSRKIAEQALAGSVFAAVGHATHYHADYVLPYWADSLDKTVQIGRHIFYRLKSSLGDSRAFFQRYAGSEPLPPKPDTAVVIPPADVTDQLASALISDGVTASAQEVEKAAPPTTPAPLIDSLHGTLIGDDRFTTEVKRPKKRSECPPSSEGKQLRPLGPNDIRAGDSHNGC